MTLKQNCWEFKNCGREPGGRLLAPFVAVSFKGHLLPSSQTVCPAIFINSLDSKRV